MMAVSRDLAFTMECGHFTDLSFRLPDEVAKEFVVARTQPWNERLNNYRAWLQEKDDPPILSPREIVEIQRHLAQTLEIKPQETDGFFVRRYNRLIRNQRLESERKRRVGTEFHGFMSLPVEIRKMIYTCALVSPTGKFVMPPKQSSKFEKIAEKHMLHNDKIHPRFADFIEPRPDYTNNDSRWSMKDQPSLALGLLLCVSKVVQSEAEAVFFGSNMILFLNSSPTASVEDSKWWSDLTNLGQALRSISIAVISSQIWEIEPDFRDDVPFWGNDIDSVRISYDMGDDEFRISLSHFIHGNAEERGLFSWYAPELYPNLEILELRLDDATCLRGCCRSVENVCRLILNTLSYYRTEPHTLALKMVKFLGLEDAGERDAINKRFRLYENLAGIRIEFE